MKVSRTAIEVAVALKNHNRMYDVIDLPFEKLAELIHRYLPDEMRESGEEPLQIGHDRSHIVAMEDGKEREL